jgi:hypothetical protein
MNADEETRNGELDELLDGEDQAALGTAPGERDIAPEEPGGTEPPPAPPDPEFLAEAGTADIGMPDEDAADELVGDDMDAAEWAALDLPMPAPDPAMPAAPVAFDANGSGTIDGAGPDEGEWEDVEARLARLEANQHQIVTAAREHEAARVRRKVVASTTGAGAAGFIPLLLQLVDALSLSPEVAATVTSAVAALGALVAGYLTPDRPPVLPPEPQSIDVSPLAVAPIAPFPAPAPPAPRPPTPPTPAAHHRPSTHA